MPLCQPMWGWREEDLWFQGQLRMHENCHLPKIRVLTIMSTRICTHLKTHSIHFVSQLTIYWFPVKIVLPLNTIAGMMWIKINLKLQQLLKFFKFIHFL